MATNAVKLAEGIARRDLRSIAKAITLVESKQENHSVVADELLSRIMAKTGQSLRIGISGIPGVGKSTFIEALGLYLISLGKRVAVLAIDPSSPVSGGSILGDKTRMEKLAMHPNSFIRPSPSQGVAGGVARKTRETALIMEAAGYDIIIIETVGVGQSEILVSSMVDVFLMLQMPSTGDELQSIKKGILEVADIVVVNKADGELAAAADRAAIMLQSAFRLVATHDGWSPPVVQCSAKNNTNVSTVWAEIERFADQQQARGLWSVRRRKQIEKWFDDALSAQLVSALTGSRRCQDLVEAARESVMTGQLAVSTAVRSIVRALVH